MFLSFLVVFIYLSLWKIISYKGISLIQKFSKIFVCMHFKKTLKLENSLGI
jgi:hypothetical protein